nr:unnamed protein product [Callosobruchus chinensis]
MILRQQGLEGDMSSVTNVLARIDNSLEQQNIDSSTCMQRVICSYVQDAEKNKKSGEMGSIDELVLTLTNNTLLSYVLDGTAVKQAVDLGRSGDPDKCSSLLPKCAITRENILQIISNILPS